jgi:two-component system, OmpR family, response regulator QseB
MANEENLANFRQRVEVGHAWDPERLLRAAGQVVVKDVPEGRLRSFSEAVATDALEAAVWSLRKRPANAAAGTRIEAKRGIGCRLLGGGDA